MTAACFCLAEVAGALLLAGGWREPGALLLCVYLVVENGLQNGEFLLMRGVDMLKLIPFLRNLALVGGLIVVGAYSDGDTSNCVSSRSGLRKLNLGHEGRARRPCARTRANIPFSD